MCASGVSCLFPDARGVKTVFVDQSISAGLYRPERSQALVARTVTHSAFSSPPKSEPGETDLENWSGNWSFGVGPPKAADPRSTWWLRSEVALAPLTLLSGFSSLWWGFSQSCHPSAKGVNGAQPAAHTVKQSSACDTPASATRVQGVPTGGDDRGARSWAPHPWRKWNRCVRI